MSSPRSRPRCRVGSHRAVPALRGDSRRVRARPRGLRSRERQGDRARRRRDDHGGRGGETAVRRGAECRAALGRDGDPRLLAERNGSLGARARLGRAARDLPPCLLPRARRDDRPPDRDPLDGRSVRARRDRAGQAPRRPANVVPVARMACAQGGRGPLHLDTRALRHPRDGERGADVACRVLGRDHEGLLPRRPESDQALARGVPRDRPREAAPRCARDRAAARRGRRGRPLDRGRRTAPLARRHGAEHPELRDLHLTRLARHRGHDRVHRAGVPRRRDDEGRQAPVRAREDRRGERDRERGAADGDDRERPRCVPRRRGLADRRAR